MDCEDLTLIGPVVKNLKNLSPGEILQFLNDTGGFSNTNTPNVDSDDVTLLLTLYKFLLFAFEGIDGHYCSMCFA